MSNHGLKQAWTTVPLWSTCVLDNGYPFDSGDFLDQGTTPLVRIRDLASEEFTKYLDVPVPARALLADGDIVVGMDGEFNVIQWNRGPAALNQRLCRLRPKPGFHAGFLRYALPQPLADIAATQFSTTVKHLSSEEVLHVRIPVPGEDTQRQVAEFLDDQVNVIERVVAERVRQIALLREYVATSEHELVWRGTGSAALVTAPLPQVGQVPGHWAQVRNKNLLTEARELSVDGSEELLSVSHITGVTRRSEKNVNMFLAETNEGYVKVAPGDLVINTMWAWMGALGVSSLTGIVSPAYGVYRPRDPQAFAPDYYDALYRSPAYVSEMTRFSTGVWSSRLRIYPEVFLSLPVIAPPPDEQKTIAKRIREVRDSVVPAIALLAQSIDLLNERKHTLITAAVTGQLDLATMSDRAGKVATA